MIALALLVAGGTRFTVSAQGRIATVDMQKVFDGYWKTKQAEAALKDRATEIEKEHKGMVDDYKKGMEEYQTLLASANDLAVSVEEREKRKQKAENKLKEMKDLQETVGQFERQARATIDEQRMRMRNNLLGEIKTTIHSRAKSAGYALVLDTAAESSKSTPIILYTNGDNDITDAVLQQLNLNAPPDAAKPATKQ